MIVIPMLGHSSRFFRAGYTLPKHQLPLNSETVFSQSVRSFERYFEDTPFLFLVRNDYGNLEFVCNQIKGLQIRDFRIIEFSAETRGQAESVALGIQDYKNATPLTIFTIDTIRYGFEMPPPEHIGDGFLEVFEGDGDGWSFVKPGVGNTVIQTAEKERISNLCSNGLYYFSKISLFRQAYKHYLNQGLSVNGELYIAPLYNLLIQDGKDIRFNLIEKGEIDHCGIPKDYEYVRSKC